MHPGGFGIREDEPAVIDRRYSKRDQSMGIANIPTKGILGGIIALGIMVTILVAVPAARWFLLFSIPAGLIVAGILHFVNRPKA